MMMIILCQCIYLYNYAGEPWKAQKWVREVMTRLYSPEPDGLCGDEDNGQTSAWYVFSAMGFYSVCPGTTQYVFGSPLFDKITLNLENGKTFVLEAENNLKDNVYVDEIILNDKVYTKNFIDHHDIRNGGKLLYKMAAEPNKERGIKPGDAPYSMSK